MASNKRQSRRIGFDRPCWLARDGAEARKDCVLLDLSEGGARLRVPASGDDKLDKEFNIHFTQDGSVSFRAERR
jgi:hypothetical protein